MDLWGIQNKIIQIKNINPSKSIKYLQLINYNKQVHRNSIIVVVM